MTSRPRAVPWALPDGGAISPVENIGDTVPLGEQEEYIQAVVDAAAEMGEKRVGNPEGTIDYTTSERDAPVEICIQSMAATSNNPSQVSLTVTQQVKRKQKQQASLGIQKHKWWT
jgi:hypothetical protein